MCYNIASDLCFGFLAMRLVGSLAPQTRIKPISPALEGEVLTTGSPAKSLRRAFPNGRHGKDRR